MGYSPEVATKAVVRKEKEGGVLGSSPLLSPEKEHILVLLTFVVILTIALSIDPFTTDCLNYKTLSLLTFGGVGAVVLFWKQYPLFSVLALVALYHYVSPAGMFPPSLIVLAYGVLFTALFYFCKNHLQDNWIKMAICVAAIFQAGYGLMQIFYDPIFTMIDESLVSWRIFGTFGNSQYWAMFLVAAIPLFFVNSSVRYFRAIGLPIVLGALLANIVVRHEIGFSEMVGVIAGLIWVAHLGIRRHFFLPFVVTSLLAGILVSVMLSFSSAIRSNVVMAFNNRLYITKETMSLIKKQPITGYGLGFYEPIMSLYDKQWEHTQARGPNKWGKDTILTYAHNEYLQAWFELGLLGLVGSVGLFCYVGWQALFGTVNMPYWYSVFIVGLFAWVHFPLHLPFMAVFLLRGKDERKLAGACGFYSGCPDNYNKLGRSK